MAKVTLNKDLVPYAQLPSKSPHLGICQDLTHNYLLACKLIRAVTVLFQLRKGSAIYSGYAYPRESGTFAIRLIHKGCIVRTIVLRNLGYAGVLQVRIRTKRVDDAVHLDLLGSLAEYTFHRTVDVE